MISPPAKIELTAAELDTILQGLIVEKVIDNRTIAISQSAQPTDPQDNHALDAVKTFSDDRGSHAFDNADVLPSSGRRESPEYAQSITPSEDAFDRDQRPCWLFQLPRELRDLIYGFLYPGNVITLVNPVHLRNRDESTICRAPTYTRNTGLLGTCKQLRSETIPFFFGRNIFQGEDIDWAPWYWRLSEEAVDALKEMRYVDSCFYHGSNAERFSDLADLLECFGKIKQLKKIRPGVVKIRLMEPGSWYQSSAQWLEGANGEEIWSSTFVE